jgi:hypothetical protein
MVAFAEALHLNNRQQTVKTQKTIQKTMSEIRLHVENLTLKSGFIALI